MKLWVYRFIAAVVCALTLAVSLFLSERAFEKVLEFRELERIPLSRLAESVGGESQVMGRVSLLEGESLTGPKSGAVSVYYRYLVEREVVQLDSHLLGREADA